MAEKRKAHKGKQIIDKFFNVIEESDGDYDCPEIGSIDFTRQLNLGRPSDDMILVADQGQIALRDFPHPRHLCRNFPFNSTAHEEYCSKCFCYVCEVAAPCKEVMGIAMSPPRKGCRTYYKPF